MIWLKEKRLTRDGWVVVEEIKCQARWPRILIGYRGGCCNGRGIESKIDAQNLHRILSLCCGGADSRNIWVLHCGVYTRLSELG